MILNSVVSTSRFQQKNYPDINLANMKFFMKNRNIDRLSLQRLNFIHVSGTKGKGSVCAIIESILRKYGLKTVRERIRINGVQLSYKQFHEYFFEIFAKKGLLNISEMGDKPGYFMLLTILAFHVDIVVLETGIGGRFDFTNIIPNNLLSVITLVDFDHMNLLGNSLEEISWNKAGIIKKNSKVITYEQKASVLKVIEREAIEKSVIHDKLFKVRFEATNLRGFHQKINCKLAVEACKEILNLSKNSETIPQNIIDGLTNVDWPGRCQKIVKENIAYYLDGSHTPLSVDACMKWFKEEIKNLTNNDSKFVLIFNCTGERNYQQLLDIILYSLVVYHFKLYSVINTPGRNSVKLWSPLREKIVNVLVV
ncbi:hypothetical protein MXB_3125 [Myxobolus squamalis]|nr:hypothetical protein MXB_3125 [Myxobolus squamalis]